VPGAAAGPSGLVLIDIDTHHDQLPPDLATGLLPGINLTHEPIPRGAWADPGRFRDGRDTLTLLARRRGGPRPWPGHMPAWLAREITRAATPRPRPATAPHPPPAPGGPGPAAYLTAILDRGTTRPLTPPAHRDQHAV